MRAKTIIPNLLYMGASPAKWTNREQRDEWLSGHVNHVVALCKRDPEVGKLLAKANTGFYADDAEVIPTADPVDLVQVHHMPVVDSHKTVAPEIPQVVVPMVVQWIKQNQPVLVTCLAGRSRSGITCGLVLRELYDLDGEEALERLRAGRPKAIKREGPEQWFKRLPRPSDVSQFDIELPPEFGP